MGGLVGTMQAAGSSGGNVISYLFPLLLLAVFFLFIIRPQRVRQRAFQATQSELAPGQEVLTTAGLYGTIAEVGPDFVLLEIAPGVRSKYARAAIAKILPPPDLGSGSVGLAADGSPQP